MGVNKLNCQIIQVKLRQLERQLRFNILEIEWV